MAEEEEPKEEPKEDPKEAHSTKATDMIIEANKAAERLEAANKKHEELIEADAKLKLNKTFDGEASAGEGKKEESDEDYAKKVMSGDLK